MSFQPPSQKTQIIGSINIHLDPYHYKLKKEKNQKIAGCKIVDIIQVLFVCSSWRSFTTGRRQTATALDNLCSLVPSFSKVAKVSKGIVFGLLDHSRVYPHSHHTRHPHGHPHPHHALVGSHAHSHAHSHTRVHHSIDRWSDCCRSEAHVGESLGEHVGRCLISWKQKWGKK